MDVLTGALTVLAVVLLRLLVLEFAVVRGSSMRPMLRNGEVMLVSLLDYHLRAPRRCEVVICHYPNRRVKHLPFLKQQFVKRVIGLPGDTLEIIEGVVHINGSPLEERYLDPARNRRAMNRGPLTLKADEYYVMGDNRDGSNDSRFVGPITRRMLVGHVRRVIWPLRQGRGVSTASSYRQDTMA